MRSIKHLVAAVFISSQLSGNVFAAPSAEANCKVIPGDPTWPKASVWKEELPQAKEQQTRGKGKHATYRIDVQNVEQAKSALQFAKKHNIRLTLLNSGHDFLGRNDAPNGLSIVTTNLKGARLITEFKPTLEGVPAVNTSTKLQPLNNAPAEAYLTFGVGYNTDELNKMLKSSKLVTLGAAHEGVSVAGGWGQTGGHSPLSPKYGLGVDHFVEFKVITADGKLRVANAVSEPDLFWALRGGGGGTWGIVVEATVRAFPSPGIGTSTFWINTTDYNDHKSIFPAVAWLHTQFPEFSDQGMTNYYYIYPNALTITSIFPADKGAKKFIDEKWQPKLRHLGTFPGVSAKSIQYTSYGYNNFYTFFDEIIVKRKPKEGLLESNSLFAGLGAFGGKFGKQGEPGKSIRKRHGPGSEMMLTQSTGVRGGDSWLLGKEHLNAPNFAKILEDSMPKDMENPQLRGQGVGGPGIFSRAGNETSVVPAWRKTYCHIIHLGSKEPDAAPMRKLAPEMGAYANEASRLMPNWRNAFWGKNYDHLSEIKKKYDPEHLFWVTPGINAEQWVVKGDRICRDAGAKVDTKSAVTEIPPKNDNQNFVDATAKGIDEYPGADFFFVKGPNGAMLNPIYSGVASVANKQPPTGES